MLLSFNFSTRHSEKNYLDAPLEDLTVPTAQEINRYRQVYLKRSSDLMRGIERRRKDTVGMTGIAVTIQISEPLLSLQQSIMPC